ncbi:hypothetical protein F8M41_025963 [Gigaspora margarita]|uniref:Uncharacterized protein n=1 Tax=Gigaspora margarita TaxID=4874 RepID=A0A8H4ESW7_GIGMA|nr:hypothetical protein F8M41_025963 [Gigaspora margarita]
MNEHYDFFLRIGVDGKDNFDKCQFIDQFANDKGVYKDTLHAYVKTTYIQLDDYTIKVEFLITGWNLRPNKNYYSYVDGAMFVCDISDTNEIKELSREYNSHATYKIPIIMIAKEWKKNNDELLNEVKKFVGEEFLFDAISINEWTIGFNKILKECVFRLSGFRDELTPSDDQIKSIMKYATRLYSFEIPSEVIYDKRIQIEELANEGIKSFLSLVCTNIQPQKSFAFS